MSAYAIIQTGGKQYRVASGDVIDIELIGESKEVTFDDVLFVSDGKKAQVGVPTVSGAVVKGEVVDHVRGPKVVAYKYKRRKNYRRKVGHRQRYAQVKITQVG